MTDASARLDDVVEQARTAHGPVFLTRRGRRVAAVIAAEDLPEIQAAAAVRAELTERGDGPVPWEPVKADLGP